MDHKTENDPVIGVPPTMAVAQQMLEYAPVTMLLVNSQGEIQHLNSAADQLFGYSKESLIGKQVETLVPDDLKQKHKLLRNGFMSAPIRRPMGEGRHLTALHKDGCAIDYEHYNLCLKQSPPQLANLKKVSTLTGKREPNLLTSVLRLTDSPCCWTNLRFME